MDAAQEIAERIAAGESRDQLYKDYCWLAMILENRFLHEESALACRRGLEIFPYDSHLQDLERIARERINPRQ